MARTEQELRDHYLALGPGFLQEPEELLDAQIRLVAAIFAEIEAAIDTFHARTFLDTADGSWLDQHGIERGVLRYDAESDTDLRVRVKLIEEKLTPVAIVTAVDALLAVGTCILREHLGDGAFSDFPGPQGYAGMGVTYDGIRAFTVLIEAQLSTRADRAYALPAATTIGTQSSAGDDGSIPDVTAFADGVDLVPSDIYGRIYQAIDRLHAGGVSFRVEITS
jgi:hypothetical protein